MAHVIKTMPRHAARRSVAPHLPDAAGAGRLGGARFTGPRRRRRGSPRSGRRPGPRSRSRDTGRRPDRSVPRSRRFSRSSVPAEKFAGCARIRIRRRSCCRRFSATLPLYAVHLAAIADDARDVDLALRWGFGSAMGPFETWRPRLEDVAGWLPRTSPPAARSRTFRCPMGHRDRRRRRAVRRRVPSAPPPRASPRSTLPVSRQHFPFGAGRNDQPARRSWKPGGAHVAPSTTSPSCRSGPSGPPSARTCSTTCWPRQRVERGALAGHRRTRDPFSLDANLSSIAPRRAGGRWSEVEGVVAEFQQAAQRLNAGLIPTVAAVHGMASSAALCGFILHCRPTVVALAVDVGWSRSVSDYCRRAAAARSSPCVRRAKSRAAPTAARSTDSRSCARPSDHRDRTGRESAREAKEIGYLRDADIVSSTPTAAARRAGHRARARRNGYRPPLPARNVRRRQDRIRDAGNDARQHARRRLHLALRFRDRLKVARVLCGGELEPGTLVDGSGSSISSGPIHGAPADARRKRIAHTLATSKPLRN